LRWTALAGALTKTVFQTFKLGEVLFAVFEHEGVGLKGVVGRYRPLPLVMRPRLKGRESRECRTG
jgi:hypothetical protein